jgi:hypothetical protein
MNVGISVIIFPPPAKPQIFGRGFLPIDQNYYLFVFGSVGPVSPGQEKGAEQAPPVDFIGWKKAGSPIGD